MNASFRHYTDYVINTYRCAPYVQTVGVLDAKYNKYFMGPSARPNGLSTTDG